METPPTLSPSLWQSAIYARLTSLVQRLGSPALLGGWESWAGGWSDASKNFLFIDLSALSFLSRGLRPHGYRNWCWQQNKRGYRVIGNLFAWLQGLHANWWPQLLWSMSLWQNIAKQLLTLEWKKTQRLQFHLGKHNQQNTNPQVSMTLIRATIFASLSITLGCPWH